MRFRLIGTVVAALACTAAAPSPSPRADGGPAQARTDARPPAPSPAFRFVVIGDRTDGARPGVFDRAMEQINLLAPTFVINVGDLIEGYSEDGQLVEKEWDEVDALTRRLEAPFYRVVGNHDIGNATMRAIWQRRNGAAHYHFRYKDVLFIALDTEEIPPPRFNQVLSKEFTKDEIRQAVLALSADPAQRDADFAANPRTKAAADRIMALQRIDFSDAQMRDVEQVIAANRDARWTFVLMHRPAWKAESSGFKRIEAALAGMPHTFLAGHLHTYDYQRRDGVDYIQMGTTGGRQDAGTKKLGTMDHVLFVSMMKDGPRIANIRLDGLYGVEGPAATAPPK
ncbi:metallophosphoesterase family protein [Sphingomonas lycopersici]|uniref:Metallophosphoesterase n=1 Tax=Sphingomonas lycopersici TaxID=2951807 RepID=A0AA41Z6L4_9SPHN|nr:metallophosphoesterase [Sphingomonas lycopersici]MCW6533802.1 metallophosphoesterase [Sphingomonas lycopersici]